MSDATTGPVCPGCKTVGCDGTCEKRRRDWYSLALCEVGDDVGAPRAPEGEARWEWCKPMGSAMLDGLWMRLVESITLRAVPPKIRGPLACWTWTVLLIESTTWELARGECQFAHDAMAAADAVLAGETVRRIVRAMAEVEAAKAAAG